MQILQNHTVKASEELVNIVCIILSNRSHQEQELSTHLIFI